MPDPIRDMLLSGIRAPEAEQPEVAADGGAPVEQAPSYSGSGPGFDLMDLVDNPVVSTAGTVLDTLARPVRTTLATGDIGRAFESIYNPDVASSVADLRGAIGIGQMNQGEGFDAGDVGDFLVDLGIGAVTDPTTYLTAGLTSVGRQAASQGARAAKLASQGMRAEALAAVGGNRARLAAGGVLPRLSQRLAAGESALQFAGIPIAGPSLAPAASALEKVGGAASQAVEAVAPGLVNWVGRARDFFREGSGYAGLDAAGQFSAGHMNQVSRDVVEPVAASVQKARALGVPEEAIGELEYVLNSKASKAHIEAVAKITGQTPEAINAAFEARFKPGALEDIIKKHNLTSQQAEAYGIVAENLTSAYQRLHDIEKAAGKDVMELGAHVLGEVSVARNELADKLRKYIPNLSTTGPGGAAVDLSAMLKDPQYKDILRDEGVQAALKAYDKAVNIASTVPGYAPLRVGRDAYEFLIERASNDPNVIRQVTNHFGQLATREEAEAAVHALGTAATGGRTPTGRIPLNDFMRAYYTGHAKGGFDGAVKAVQDAMEKAGKMYKSDPFEVFADRVSATTRAVGNADYIKGIRAIMGEELPDDVLKLYDDIADSKRANQHDKVRVLEAKLQARLGRGTMDGVEGMVKKGQVRASDLERFSHLKGTKNDFLLPAEAADAVVRHFDSLRKPEAYGGVFRPLAAFTSAWKSATVAPPSSMLRNKIGGLFQRWQGGGLDSESLADEARIVMVQRALGKGDKKAAANVVFHVGNGQTMNGLELTDKLRELGALNSGFWHSDLTDPAKEALLKKGLLNKALHKPREIAGAIENGDKFGHVLARLRAGDSIEQASLSANKYLFNYSSASPFVQMMRSTGIMPFAAFTMKNLPLQFESLLKSPGKFTALLHAKNAVEDGVPGLKDEELPSYVRNKFNVTFRRNKDGSVDFVTLDGVIPAADLPKVTDMREFLTGLLGPLPKTGIEWVTNRDLFDGRQIEEFDGQVKPLFGMDVPVRGQYANVLENLLPRSNVATQVGKAVSGEEVPYVGSAPKAVAGLALPLQAQTNRLRAGRNAPYEVDALRQAIGRVKGEIKREQTLRPHLARRYTQQLVELERRLVRLQSAQRQQPNPLPQR